jgi:hypothetical protein
MTHKAILWLDVWSSRDGVNVIIPGTNCANEGNNRFPAARGNVREYVARTVADALEHQRSVRAARLRLAEWHQSTHRREYGNGVNLPDGYTIGEPYPVPGERGHYRVTVWAPITR